MFDRLVESTSQGEGGKRASFFGITALTLATLFLAVFVWSLYSVNLGLGEEDLSLAELVAPVALPDEKPQPPTPPDQPKQKAASEDNNKNFDVRPQLIQSINESPKIPDNVSTKKNDIPARREGVPTQIGTRPTNGGGDTSGLPERSGTGTSNGPPIKNSAPPVTNDTEKAPDAPPTPKPTPKPTPTPEKKPPATISGGVLNGKASRLVQPPYPPAARAVHASGQVNVQVTIDEQGNVISASATTGNPLLRAAATQAARSSKFTPTTLSGQAVKVTGVISYNFVAQ